MHYNKSNTITRKLVIAGIGAVNLTVCDGRPTHYLMMHVHFAAQVNNKDAARVASACEAMCDAMRTRMATFFGHEYGAGRTCPENRTWPHTNYYGDWWCWEFWCGRLMNEPEFISRFIEVLDVDGWFVPTMEKYIAEWQ